MAMSFPEKKISLKDEEQCHHDEEQCYHVYRKAQGESYWIDNWKTLITTITSQGAGKQVLFEIDELQQM